MFKCVSSDHRAHKGSGAANRGHSKIGTGAGRTWAAIRDALHAIIGRVVAVAHVQRDEVRAVARDEVQVDIVDVARSHQQLQVLELLESQLQG